MLRFSIEKQSPNKKIISFIMNYLKPSESDLEDLFIFAIQQPNLTLEFLNFFRNSFGAKKTHSTMEAAILSNRLEIIKSFCDDITNGFQLQEMLRISVKSRNLNTFKFFESKLKLSTPNPSQIHYFDSFLGTIEYGCIEILKYILSIQKFELNTSYTRGETPLTLAVQRESSDMIQFLVEMGSDPNLMNPFGETPLLKLVLFQTLPEMCKYLIGLPKSDLNLSNKKTRETPLMIASREGKIEIVKLLVENGADIDKTDLHGETALWKAYYNFYSKVVDYLFEKGSNANVTNNSSETLLTMSADRGDLAMVQFLVEKKGIDVNRKTNSNWTALVYAVDRNRIDIVKYLVEHGSRWLEMKQFLLQKTITRGYLELMRYFVESSSSDQWQPSDLLSVKTTLKSNNTSDEENKWFKMYLETQRKALELILTENRNARTTALENIRQLKTQHEEKGKKTESEILKMKSLQMELESFETEESLRKENLQTLVSLLEKW